MSLGVGLNVGVGMSGLGIGLGGLGSAPTSMGEQNLAGGIRLPPLKTTGMGGGGGLHGGHGSPLMSNHYHTGGAGERSGPGVSGGGMQQQKKVNPMGIGNIIDNA